MAEFTNVQLQEVKINQNVLFADTTSNCNSGCVGHRTGSGLITLSPKTNNCKAKFRVDFSGNISVPSTGTAGEISLAIAINGEPDLSTKAVVTPTATQALFNVATGTDIWVKRGCCVQVSIKNTSDQAIDVSNSNITVNRIG